ncbi:MAG: hypothetical protein WAQ27_06085 [Candidatus Microsaccharimonas sp.]
MSTTTSVSLDDLVYDKVVDMGGSFTAARGENFANNVGRAISMPHRTSFRDVYHAVCRLVQQGRLVRNNTESYTLRFGSLARPSRVAYPVAEYSIVS